MPTIEWREIPAGPFVMGSVETSDNPLREASTGAFLLARHPITNRQYADFAAACPDWRPGAPPDELADSDYLRDWEAGSFPEGTGDLPVAWISWHAASAFCEWAGRELGGRIVLPTEVMWEKAARGAGGRRYPWGDEIDPGRANYSSRAVPIGRLVDGRVPVCSYTPRGDSPFGCADMAGNVWEWCADWMDEYEEERALRGGAWNFTPDFLRCCFRFGCDPRASYNYIGFRPALLPLP
jgi:formylglycine-generating enzyme required for sulfatase activity